MPDIDFSRLDRRAFLRATLAATVAAAGLPLASSRASTQALAQNTPARIAIAGAGAAGLAVAAQLARRLDRAEITLIDDRITHLYQPGFTLVAAGLWSPDRVQWANERYIPSRVRWVRSQVAEFDPEANRVVAKDGTAVPYDFLIVATGLDLRYDLIEGMEKGLIGTEHRIGSVYAGPDDAFRTWQAMAHFREQGGDAVFTRPPGDLKCAGAPLKMTFITDDRLRETGMRSRARVTYAAHDGTLFSVKPVNEKVKELFAGRDIAVAYSHVLEAVDPGRRIARFRHGAESVEMRYDFLHVVPPMRAAPPVADGPLSWKEGPFAAQGWLEVDRDTLQHRRYPNIFGVGDVNGVPRGKTAASVKWQAPVAVQNLIDTMAGKPPSAVYNGYTSCPMITRIGQAMLVEFDYEGRLIPTLPLIDPLAESWAAWIVEEKALRPVYAAMLRGFG
ncbi:MAG: FAD/NAD(P)-binding oxidoreductase [Oceanibaculum nanhaiense]|jgi:sulfide:quinone oxidoreductase|uniref:NAD(P)/FAD-dependent oxidoreductase n=1 Tax=Oceanibaculum nanhaiense TaxID=1909734 RepID=UPI0032EE871D